MNSRQRRGWQSPLKASSSAEPMSAPPPPSGDSAEGPWSKEDLERMVEEEFLEDEEALGGTWRMFFEDDPAELFEYTERAYDQYEGLLEEALQMSATDRRVRERPRARPRADQMNWFEGLWACLKS